ncbi:MAG TPA: hypothetical protein VHY20_07660 [Pirellulales bacterium]|jgi:hypothetical protein|nr:hypothetical protein [Pirellulales bacterium]
MITRRILLRLAAWSALAPVPLAVLVALGRLLAALGDARGARIVDAVALAVGVGWAIGLIGLVLALAGYLLFPPEDDGES